MKLSQDVFKSIEQAMFSKGRDLEVAAFNKNLPKEYIVSALSEYVYKDGGFGQVIDPNCCILESNVYGAFMALQLLYETDVSKEDKELEKMLKKTFNYLYNRAPKVNDKWNYLLDDNKNLPVSEQYKKNFKQLNYHPTASLIFYTLHFSDEFSHYHKVASKMASRLVEIYLRYETCDAMEVYGFALLARYFKNEELSNKVKKDMKVILKDKKTFTYEECLMALDFDYLEKEIRNTICDDIVSRLKPFMLWEENLDWQNDRAEQDVAKMKYLGIWTYNYVRLLEKNGYIQGE